jgi:hypothetical protein
MVPNTGCKCILLLVSMRDMDTVSSYFLNV